MMCGVILLKICTKVCVSKLKHNSRECYLTLLVMWTSLPQNFEYSTPILARSRRYLSLVKLKQVFTVNAWLLTTLNVNVYHFNVILYSASSRWFWNYFLRNNIWSFFKHVLFLGQGPLTNALTVSYKYATYKSFTPSASNLTKNKISQNHTSILYLRTIFLVNLPISKNSFMQHIIYLLTSLLIRHMGFTNSFHITTHYILIQTSFFILYFYNVFFFKIHHF